MTDYSVTAVIVTYNRLSLLKDSIEKVLSQDTSALRHLIIVNGASTDGTKEFLDNLSDKRIIVENLDQNLGGSGGFNWGIKQFYQKTADDFVWVMDDDSMPTSTALRKLLTMFELNADAGWGASKVNWIDGEWARMNVPAPADGGKTAVYYGDENFVPIKHATFVSTIFKRSLIKTIGLPQKEYFIWGDDIEFTERAHRVATGYFVRDSIVIHASKTNPNPGDIVGETLEERLPRYMYEYRNRILTSRRRQSIFKLIKTIGHGVIDFMKTLFLPGVQYRGRKLKIIIKGTINGFFFHPNIEFADDLNDKHH
ncbi:glycosyltransferase family 2 protein [Leuconostoc falkenbergense]|uniref:glycosyltransferase family 2 protein n=1 Tax=Leuconostoc falkenbergense TaxID=2766470 RepID=UPI0002738938|nr:glycosyltransferase family 2 protein [Leuconostoc falkenbergense]OQJ69592.1 glycosyl transferase [Leuconostoc pseudomesenteroides]CCJ66170.1 Predicted glycosyltransferase [Leuconostoc pseudomesenteroides 4882]OQJ79517.1 glycosyl transferase [Leuconostoc pseudomesenteroides]OQJ81154.1 glycosyl transferase [Leuconostoc pseudomesenteroides]ORI86293.1 glycosyl transferase [Leuconostoc pseudomesenteroides]